MAYIRTVAQMIDTARAVADEQDSEFVTEAEAIDELNYWLADLWREVEFCDPDHWFKQTDIVTTAGTTSYDLPSDFRAIRRLDRVNGSIRIMIDPVPLQEADRNGNGFTNAPYDCRYRIMGNAVDGTERRLHFFPDPGSFTYELLYVQAPQRFDDVSDVFDGEAGWERYAILGLAFHMRRKADRDLTGIVAEQARMLANVQAQARRRDAARPPRIADVRDGWNSNGRWRLPGPP